MHTRAIISGSRGFTDYALLKKTCDTLPDDTVIISGCARGADRLGEKYAKTRGLRIERFHTDRDRYGKSAGAIRNREMAKAATVLIAFWDGVSKGTADMIRTAQKMNLKVTVIQCPM